MAAKPVGFDTSILQNLADHAHKLLHEFVELPSDEQQRSAELMVEFENVIAEFKRLRPAPVFKGARRLWLAETAKPRLCSICEQAVHLAGGDYFETEGAIYHRACYSRVIDSQ
jgi:hypothetical protein